MNHPTLRRISAAIIGLTLACAPALASAQNVSSTSTNEVALQSQIQSLLAELASLRQQLGSITGQASSTMPWMPNMGSSTPTQWMSNASSTGMMPPPPPGGMMASSSIPMRGGGCPMINRTLSVGSSGSDVSNLQQFLANLPGNLFPAGDVTGFFGPLTKQAVGMFQMQTGISSSSAGVVGPLTRAFFSYRCNNQPSNGAPMASSTAMNPAMIQWVRNGNTISPLPASQKGVEPAMMSYTGTSTLGQIPWMTATATMPVAQLPMWNQGSSSEPYWMKPIPPDQNQQQQPPQGGVPPWMNNQ